MIDIKSEKDCCGCNACEQACPKRCISMVQDAKGFSYPEVDLSHCIDCHICERVCPIINQCDERFPVEVCAARNANINIKKQSSSGGIFKTLALKAIADGGVVFGASFNKNNEVRHSFCEDAEGVDVFVGSKYVQSNIGDSYRQAEAFLKNGRLVLFSGTSCQIAGLQRFLRKDYGDLLIKVEVICHGVPSPRIWNDYLNYYENYLSVGNIHQINFRDKNLGWERFGFSFHYNDKTGKGCKFFQNRIGNPFMLGFLSNLNLRPSCFSCPAKSGKSLSDISMADFWGIKNNYPSLYDFYGTSLLLLYTDKGCAFVDSCKDIIATQVDFDIAKGNNPAIFHSAEQPTGYCEFWTAYVEGGIDAIESIVMRNKSSLTKRAIFVIKGYIEKMRNK